MYVELPRIHTFLYGIIGYGGTNVDQEDLLWEYGAVFNTGYAGGLAYVPGATSANLPYYDIHNHEIGHNLGSGIDQVDLGAHGVEHAGEFTADNPSAQNQYAFWGIRQVDNLIAGDHSFPVDHQIRQNSRSSSRGDDDVVS